MSQEEHKEYTIDQAYALIKHADHILSSLCAAQKTLTDNEADYFDSKVNSQIIDNIKHGKKIDDKKLSIDKKKAWGIGSTLRQTFNTISHFQKFQNQCLHTLLNAQDASSTFALSYNSEFVMPLLQLFVKYVKLHVLLSQIKNIVNVPILYYYCKQRTLGESQLSSDIFSLPKYLKERISFNFLEAELQPLVKRFEDVLVTAKSYINNLITADQTFNWSQFALSENPSVTPPKGNFMDLQYFVAMNLNLFVDALISLLFVNVSAAPKFNDVFQSIVKFHPYFELVADIKIPISSMFEALKRFTTKKEDLSSSFFEKAVLTDIDRKNIVFREKKIASLIQEFINAGESDVTSICFKIQIFFALLGYGNFVFSSNMGITAKDDLHRMHLATIDLLSTLTSAAFLILKNTKPIKRFFLYNLREYDYPNLLALVYPLRLEKPLYDKVTYVANSLQYIQLDAFDNGTPIDIFPLKLAIGNVMACFNKYSTNHGVVHLPPLFQLLASISFHVRIATEPIDVVFESLEIFRFWQYRKFIEAKLSSTPNEFKGTVVTILGLPHFYSYDQSMASEDEDFYKKIPKTYLDMEKIIISIIEEWVEKQSQNSFELQKDSAVLRAGEARFIQALRSLISIGTITICGEQFNLLKRILPTINAIIPNVIGRQSSIPPYYLNQRVAAISKFLRLCLLSVGVNPNSVISRNMIDITHVQLSYDNGVPKIDGKMGRIPHIYFEFYKNYIKKNIKQTYYSTILRTFIDCKETADSVSCKAPLFLSHTAFSALGNILDDDGCKAFDILLAQGTVDTLESVAESFSLVIPSDTTVLNMAEHTSKCITSLIQAGKILKIRQLFNQAKHPNTPLVDPHEDAILAMKLKDSTFLQNFDTEKLPNFIISLFSAGFWSDIEYDVGNGAFTNDSHLLPYIFDAIFGVKKFHDSDFDTKKHCNIMMKAMVEGIEKIKKVDKKLLMYVLVDFIVKESVYADYSMIDEVLPYQVIRSVYSTILQQG